MGPSLGVSNVGQFKNSQFDNFLVDSKMGTCPRVEFKMYVSPPPPQVLSLFRNSMLAQYDMLAHYNYSWEKSRSLLIKEWYIRSY